jgi:dihydroflavonol-4-reductase
MKKRIAFVTGSTGLLGNNLVRALVGAGWKVRALARTEEKAKKQFNDLVNVEIVIGDMNDVPQFSKSLAGVDVVFHVAAFFRDNYKGGSHWAELERINVKGTADLVRAAYALGVRRFVQTSSIAVLNGAPGMLINESCERQPDDADDYYRSKILADQEVKQFLATHPDMFGVFVLPGWMWGPGDIGPTSSGQVALDTVMGKLPGLTPGSFSVVDARDVASALIEAETLGQRGERYLAAGRHMTMRDLIPIIGKVAGVKTPTRELPMLILWIIAILQEIWARVSGKPILLSLATVRLLGQETDRSRFDHSKSERVLGLKFRPVELTIEDTIAWYRRNKWLPVND